MKNSNWITLVVSAAVTTVVLIALAARNKNLQQELAKAQGKSRSQDIRDSSPAGASDPSGSFDPAQSQERINRALATIGELELVPAGLKLDESMAGNLSDPGVWMYLKSNRDAMREQETLYSRAFPEVVRSVAGYSFDELIAVADATEESAIKGWLMRLAAEQDPMRMAGDQKLRAGLSPREVMEALARKDPAAALSLLGPMKARESDPDFPDTIYLMSEPGLYLRIRMATKLLGTDLEQGLQTFLEIHENVASGNKGRIPNGLFGFDGTSSLPEGSVPGVIEAMGEPEYAAIRADLLGMTLTELMFENGVSAFVQHADSMQLTPAEVETAFKKMQVLGGLETDPKAMVEWILEAGPDSLPSAVLDWAKLDQRAATDWLDQLEPSSARDQTIARFATEAAKIDPEGAEAWVNEIQDAQIRVGALRQVVFRNPTSDNFRSLLEQSPGDRQENLNGFLRQTKSLFGKKENDSRFREELLGQMTAAERLAAFESLPTRLTPQAVRVIRENFEGTLNGLGHSPEEIDRMLPGGSIPKPNDSTQEQ